MLWILESSKYCIHTHTHTLQCCNAHSDVNVLPSVSIQLHSSGLYSCFPGFYCKGGGLKKRNGMKEGAIMHKEEDVAGKVLIEKDTEGSMVGKGI